MIYPQWRRDLVGYLEALSDLEYQREYWVGGRGGDSFDEAIHFFYDDSELNVDSRACIGSILENEEEAKFIEELTRSIDFVLDRYGLRLADAEYMKTPEWTRVMKSAKAALDVVLKSGNVG